MYGTELYIAIIIGALLSLIYTEITGILPAGIVVPGYLALNFDQPYTLIIIVLISLMTFLIVKGLSKWIIIYGRRKFVMMITVGVILSAFIIHIIHLISPILSYEASLIAGIGVIVPGILANTIERQGLPHTLFSTFFVAGMTYFILVTYNTVI